MDARRLATITTLLQIAVIALWSGTAQAASCGHSVESVGSAFVAQGHCASDPGIGANPSTNTGAGPRPASAVGSANRTELRSPCHANLGAGQTGANNCAQNNCPPGENVYELWHVSPRPEYPMGIVCVGPNQPAAPGAAAVAPPQVTAAMVLQAFRRIPLPSLRSHSQPANKTLINFDTIFFTEAEPLTRQLTLLGQRVRLEITPSRFEWEHGDGTTATTTTPGAPYPAKDIVYRYADAHRTVAHRVSVTWSAEYSLNGGPLKPVDGTVTTTGPATPLRVAEASPALSGSGH